MFFSINKEEDEKDKELEKKRDFGIEFNLSEDFISPGSLVSPDDDSITPVISNTIFSENNNKDKEFSTDGISDREFNGLDKRHKNLLKSKENATQKELQYLEDRIDFVKEKIDENRIHNRFEILDL